MKDIIERATNPNFRCVSCSCSPACWVSDSVLSEGPAEPRIPIFGMALNAFWKRHFHLFLITLSKHTYRCSSLPERSVQITTLFPKPPWTCKCLKWFILISNLMLTHRQCTHIHIHIHKVGSTIIQCVACPGSW